MLRRSRRLLKVYLPMDLWMEVLARLPVKSLLKFRYVCKTWCSIIDSPEFTSLHLNSFKINSEKSHLLAIIEGRLYRFCSAKYTKSALGIKIHELCRVYNGINGLLFMVDGVSEELKLWNPSIGKCLLLPPLPFGSVHCFRYYMGFSPCSNDYKVLVFDFSTLVKSKPLIAVYSVNDHIWRVKNKPNVPDWLFSERMSMSGFVFSQGAGHWIICDSKQGAGRERHTHVVSFDYGLEEFSYIEVPHLGEDMVHFLFILGESLAVFGISSTSSHIWVMQRECGKEPWSLLYSGGSSFEEHSFFRCGVFASELLLYVERSGCFLSDIHGIGESYNFRRRQIKYLGKCFHPGADYVDTYVESLVLCKASEGQTVTSFP